MTEHEWLTSESSGPMFGLLRARKAGTARQRLLLALACCERVLPFMSVGAQPAVGITERFLRGEATEAERWAAFERGGEAYEDASDKRTAAADWCAYRLAQLAGETSTPANWDDDTAVQISMMAPSAFGWIGGEWNNDRYTSQLAEVAGLVRCVFGNPFRPVTFDPSWRTSTVLALAQGIYDFRDFSAMPILADALQDAGCDNEEILNHCRDANATHVRGCWAVDLALAKQ